MRVIDYIINFEKKKRGKESEILRKIRLLVPAQKANITPPLGPTLGQFGINIKEFCEKFNEKSANVDPECMVIVLLTLYRSKIFTFSFKAPPLPFLVNEDLVELEDEYVPTYVSLSSLFKIIQIKKLHIGYLNEEAIGFSVLGTCRSMHIKIVNDIFEDFI